MCSKWRIKKPGRHLVAAIVARKELLSAGELSLLKSKTKRSKFVNMESEKSKENDSEGNGIDNSNLSEPERCERGKHKAIKG